MEEVEDHKPPSAGGDLPSPPLSASATTRSTIAATTPEKGTEGEGGISYPAQVCIIIISCLIFFCCSTFFLLWLRKRRARRRALLAGEDDDGDNVALSEGGSVRSGDDRLPRSPRKLRKFASASGWPVDKEGVMVFYEDWDNDKRYQRRSMPILSGISSGGAGVGLVSGQQRSGGKKKEKGHAKSQSCKWPSASSPIWEENNGFENVPLVVMDPATGRKVVNERARGVGENTGIDTGLGRVSSWPLKRMVPVMPRAHHTVHGYGPYSSGAARWQRYMTVGESQEALLGPSDRIQGYGQLRAFARILPEPSRPAVVVDKDRYAGLVRSSTRTSLQSQHGFPHVPGASGVLRGISLSPGPSVASPHSPASARSLPLTPSRSRSRVRADSTDSTLSEILKSTEKRLRAGSVGATGTSSARRLGHRRIGSISAITMRTSQECLLPHKECGGVVSGHQRSGSRCRTPSPKKAVGLEPSSGGHKSQDSEVSVVSESDSLTGEECIIPEGPTGLTTPHRNVNSVAISNPPPSQEREVSAKSCRDSIDSALSLSTIVSEDDMPEEVKRAIRPMDGFVVTPQRAMGIQPPSPHENDPFVMAPPPLTIARPPYQRRMTVATSQASCSVQSHELILAPGPTINPSSRAHSQQSTESQSQNNNRQSVVPTGPLFVRLTKTSTLSNIPALPPPSAPATGALREPRRKTLSPAKTISFADELVTAKVSPPEISQPIIRRSPTLLLPSTDSPSPPSSPTRASKRGERNPSMLSPQINTTIGLTKKRSSTSSSLYSIEGPDSKVPISAVELNTVSFRSNSRLSLIAGDSSPGDDHLAITSTIASLRRMNSTMSTASITFPSSSSTNQIVHSRRPPSPSLGISLAAQQRKSIGTGNYLSLGRGGKRHLPQSPHSALKKPKRLSGSSRPLSSSSSSSSRPVSREIIPLAYPVHDSHNRSSSGWEWGGSFPESSPSNSPPHKRRKPASMHQRRNSLLRMSVLETLEDMCGPVPSGSVSGRFTESIEEKENTPPRTTTTTGRAREEEIEQPPKGEFTFVVSNPDASYDLRSMNHEHRQQQQQASMRPWNHSSLASSATSAAIGMERRQNNGSPSRQSVRSVRSVDSLGLYDPQGFLIGTPQRGNSPTKFGGGSGDRNGGGRSPSPGKLRM